MADKKAQMAYNTEADMIINEQLKKELPDGVLKRMPKIEATENDFDDYDPNYEFFSYSDPKNIGRG